MLAKTKMIVVLAVVAAVAGCRREVISATDDPATVVRNAEMKFFQDFSHRCRTEASGNSGPGHRDKMVFEVAGPNRYRVVSEQQQGQGTQTGELLVIGDAAYRREGSGAWQKLGPEWTGYLRRSGAGGPPLPISSGMGYRIDAGTVRFTGRETVEGEATLRYESDIDDHVEMTKKLVYWVGVHDGLPHKTEESVETKIWGSAPI
jgi:hypothetical protein